MLRRFPRGKSGSAQMADDWNTQVKLDPTFPCFDLDVDKPVVGLCAIIKCTMTRLLSTGYNFSRDCSESPNVPAARNLLCLMLWHEARLTYGWLLSISI